MGYKKKKNNFLLSNDNKTIKIKYSGCDNMFFLNYNFINECEYSFGISLNTFGIYLDHINLGFINENFDKSKCLCQVPQNSFYINVSYEKIYIEKKRYNIKLENKTSFRFVLNLKNKTLDFKNYDSGLSYGNFSITGKSFKFFVSKCNHGEIEYTLLP